MNSNKYGINNNYNNKNNKKYIHIHKYVCIEYSNL